MGKLDQSHDLSSFQALKERNWIDNRTRALIVEFSVYNAQTEYLTMATITAEFIGGGVVTKYRFDPRILFTNSSSFMSIVVLFAEILFVVSVLYLIIREEEEGGGRIKHHTTLWNVTTHKVMLGSFEMTNVTFSKFYTGCMVVENSF